MKLFNRKLEETYMFDFIINLFAEIADFFFTFWADNVIDKFAKRKKINNTQLIEIFRGHKYARDK